jgi:hypothetical protein
MTINRTTLENGNTQFEEYKASSNAPYLGQELELPMWGPYTAMRVRVVSITQHPHYRNTVLVEAEPVKS